MLEILVVLIVVVYFQVWLQLRIEAVLIWVDKEAKNLDSQIKMWTLNVLLFSVILY